MSSQFGLDTPIVDLTHEEKIELLHMYGGQYISSYMAKTMEEAATNFPSPVALPKDFQVLT